ncbi:hypothetical protein Hdeb2414_s0010g00340411 [Helianthus debilis subsp. tardiflorus]
MMMAATGNGGGLLSSARLQDSGYVLGAKSLGFTCFTGTGRGIGSGSVNWSNRVRPGAVRVQLKIGFGSGQLGQHSQTESTELTRSVQLSGSTFRRDDLGYCRMHVSKPRLGNDIIEVVIS